MDLKHRHRRLLARLLALAWVVVALAPTLSRAMAFNQGQIGPWSQVCSTAGTLAEGMQAPDGVHSHWLEHCPMCQLGGDAPGWPAMRRAGLALWAAAPLRPVPPLWLHSPRPLPIWAAVRSRAPPPVQG